MVITYLLPNGYYLDTQSLSSYTFSKKLCLVTSVPSRALGTIKLLNRLQGFVF
jgi:hypothetical protein